jgi:hypothetical protein
MMRSRLLRISVAVLVVATLSLGMVALAKKPGKPPGPGGGGGCPAPAKWCVCYALYAPVVCGDDDCWYSNDCWASCAGFEPSECTPQGPGPIPFP